MAVLEKAPRERALRPFLLVLGGLGWTFISISALGVASPGSTIDQLTPQKKNTKRRIDARSARMPLSFTDSLQAFRSAQAALRILRSTRSTGSVEL